MEITIYEKPCLIMEAMELVYSWVNHIPAEELTYPDPMCIPAEEVEHIRQAVCGDMDPGNEELQFYFKGVPLEVHEGNQERLSCLAISMIGTVMPVGCHTVDEAETLLHNTWFAQNQPFLVGGIGVHALSCHRTDKFTTLTKEFSKLTIPANYRSELVEVFSAFSRHIDRLIGILRPVAERLKPLLQPWVQAAALRVQQWRDYLSTEEGVAWILRVCNITDRNIQKLGIALRYFSPDSRPGMYEAEEHTLRFHYGISRMPGELRQNKSCELELNDYAVLRLLSSPDRYAIFRAMRKEPKSMQDLTVELGINSGTIFRVVNNMYSVGLLNMEVISGRNHYTVSRAKLEKVTRQIFCSLEEN